MALREVRIKGDAVLEKETKPIKEMTDNIRILIGDMIDTMRDKDGVGLAAPQVGVMRSVCVIDVGEENGMTEPLVLINPEVIATEGEQTGAEGCLSLPGYVGDVTRPMVATVRALNMDMEEFEVTGEGLLARALCHEIDHLHGHMYTEFVEGPLRSVSDSEEEEDEDEE